MSLRVLVADDSSLFRRILSEALSSLPDVEVVGTALNGRIAIQKVASHKPDLLTLDMEMPEMDGLAVLDALRENHEEVAVLIVSAMTVRGGRLTMKALEKGAYDFITKPEGADVATSRALITAELQPRLRTLANRLEIRRILRAKSTPPQSPPSAPPAAATMIEPRPSDDVAARMSRIVGRQQADIVLIGVSTGGPNALAKLIPFLPHDLGVPILIVQHMPPLFTKSLADNLASKSSMPVHEGAHGMLIEPGSVYIAPGGHQMRVTGRPDGQLAIEINDDPPENNCRPSVDYLFRSVAHQFPGRAVGVILTGMGNDGTLGLRLLKRSGCYVIAQDEASCVVYGMPKAAVEAGVVDVSLPIDAIAPRLVAAVRGRS